MSYEGYEQYICKNGHHTIVDAYDADDVNKWTCPYCNAKMAWWNSVDVTNGSYCHCEMGRKLCDNKKFDGTEPPCEYCEDGRIDGYVALEIDQDDKFVECKCCGSKKIVSDRTYKIPEGKGHKV